MKTAHRQSARAKREQRTQQDAPLYALPGALVGFGIAFDPRLGRDRNWYQNEGDVKRWAENGQPMEHHNGPQ